MNDINVWFLKRTIVEVGAAPSDDVSPGFTGATISNQGQRQSQSLLSRNHGNNLVVS